MAKVKSRSNGRTGPGWFRKGAHEGDYLIFYESPDFSVFRVNRLGEIVGEVALGRTESEALVEAKRVAGEKDKSATIWRVTHDNSLKRLAVVLKPVSKPSPRVKTSLEKAKEEQRKQILARSNGVDPVEKFPGENPFDAAARERAFKAGFSGRPLGAHPSFVEREGHAAGVKKKKRRGSGARRVRITSTGVKRTRKIDLKPMHTYLIGHTLDEIVVTKVTKDTVHYVTRYRGGVGGGFVARREEQRGQRWITEDLIANAIESYNQQRSIKFVSRKVTKVNGQYDYVMKAKRGTIVLQMPSLNKQDHWEDYAKQLPGGKDYDGMIRTLAVVIGKKKLSAAEYDELVVSLLTDRSWMKGKGGHRKIGGEYATEVIEVTAPKRSKFYIDPEGYAYARYVLFPKDARSSWKPRKPGVKAAPTLNEALAKKGYTTSAASAGRKNIHDRSGEVVLQNATADEVWKWLKKAKKAPKKPTVEWAKRMLRKAREAGESRSTARRKLLDAGFSESKVLDLLEKHFAVSSPVFVKARRKEIGKTKKAKKFKWKEDPGSPGIQAPLSFTGDYVVSHRPGHHTVSYRPPGQHHYVGSYSTKDEAIAAAEQHAVTHKPKKQWGQRYGDDPYRIADGRMVWMHRKGQKVRFYTADGDQVGPEQSNVAPAVAFARNQNWKLARKSSWKPVTKPAKKKARKRVKGRYCIERKLAAGWERKGGAFTNLENAMAKAAKFRTSWRIRVCTPEGDLGRVVEQGRSKTTKRKPAKRKAAKRKSVKRAATSRKPAKRRVTKRKVAKKKPTLTSAQQRKAMNEYIRKNFGV